jgi:hypothetical protein
VIEVERIRSPLFLDCGGGDRLAFVSAGARGRSAPADLPPTESVDNGVGALVPSEPFTAGTNVALMAIAGDTATANWHPDADLWPHLLAFLQRYG